MKPKLVFFAAWSVDPKFKKLLLLSAKLFKSICDFVFLPGCFHTKLPFDLRPGISIREIFLSFNDTGSEIINGPEFEFNNSYRVTRCHSIDELINSSNKSYNIDEKLVISEEGSRVFNHVQTRLICMASFSPSVLMQFTCYPKIWMYDWPYTSGYQIQSFAGVQTNKLVEVTLSCFCVDTLYLLL